MRLPKSILICGVAHRVLTDPTHNGGSWDEAKKIIEIGTQYPADVPEVLLHEILEATMSIRDVRYVLEKEELTNDHYRFVMNHKDFEQMIKDVAVSLHGISFK